MTTLSDLPLEILTYIMDLVVESQRQAAVLLQKVARGGIVRHRMGTRDWVRNWARMGQFERRMTIRPGIGPLWLGDILRFAGFISGEPMAEIREEARRNAFRRPVNSVFDPVVGEWIARPTGWRYTPEQRAKIFSM